MLFNSFPFVWLVAITFFIYYLPVFSRYQVAVLIIASLVFYSYTQPALLLLLLSSVCINLLASYYVVYWPSQYQKLIAISGVACNLLLLGFFKYSSLFAKTFLAPDTQLGDFLLSIPLPVGISFFTFQGISLVIDVFKGNYFKGRDMVPSSLVLHGKRTLFFIAFFPQLVAGPIVKAHDFLPQIRTKYISDIPWDLVFRQLVLGYFLKMVVADNLKDFTFWIAYPYFQSQSAINLIVMLFGYSAQIFADFAGYSIIAIGLAHLFGYKLGINFNFPYIASSFKEFWKRWHISLSSFLMEYLYFPLGGNRKGKLRTYLNLIITMLLGGLWHGAAWSYAVWGAFHGFALVIERFLVAHFTLKSSRLVLIMKRLLVFVFVTFAWLLFKLPNFNDVVSYLQTIHKNWYMPMDWALCMNVLLYAMPVFLYHVAYLLKDRYSFLFKFDYVCYGLMLFLILTNSGYPGSFIYFQF